MVPLTINPIYTFYSGYLLGLNPLLKGSLGVKQLGYHLKGTIIFPMILLMEEILHHHPVNNGITYLSADAGFLLSTVHVYI